MSLLSLIGRRIQSRSWFKEKRFKKKADAEIAPARLELNSYVS